MKSYVIRVITRCVWNVLCDYEIEKGLFLTNRPTYAKIKG